MADDDSKVPFKREYKSIAVRRKKVTTQKVTNGAEKKFFTEANRLLNLKSTRARRKVLSMAAASASAW